MISPERMQQFADMMTCLQTAVEADIGAMHCLMAMRVPTNEAMLDHPDVVVRKEEVAPYISLGPLGVINGMLTAAGFPRISMQFAEVKDANGKKVDENGPYKFVGFAMVPLEHQPEELQKEIKETELEANLKKAVVPLPTADQKLWEIIGVLMNPDANINNQYSRIIAEIEEYFGVGDGVKPVLTKGTQAIKALQELVETKNMKDSAGKTPEYETRRLAAWAEAERVLAIKLSVKNQDTP